MSCNPWLSAAPSSSPGNLSSARCNYNFKVRATWLTPQIIKARARLEQLSKSLTAAETQKLAADALNAGDIVIQIEIDPGEGSGVIPSGRVALFGNPPASSEVLVPPPNYASFRPSPQLLRETMPTKSSGSPSPPKPKTASRFSPPTTAGQN